MKAQDKTNEEIRRCTIKIKNMLDYSMKTFESTTIDENKKMKWLKQIQKMQRTFKRHLKLLNIDSEKSKISFSKANTSKRDRNEESKELNSNKSKESEFEMIPIVNRPEKSNKTINLEDSLDNISEVYIEESKTTDTSKLENKKVKKGGKGLENNKDNKFNTKSQNMIVDLTFIEKNNDEEEDEISDLNFSEIIIKDSDENDVTAISQINHNKTNITNNKTIKKRKNQISLNSLMNNKSQLSLIEQIRYIITKIRSYLELISVPFNIFKTTYFFIYKILLHQRHSDNLKQIAYNNSIDIEIEANNGNYVTKIIVRNNLNFKKSYVIIVSNIQIKSMKYFLSKVTDFSSLVLFYTLDNHELVICGILSSCFRHSTYDTLVKLKNSEMIIKIKLFSNPGLLHQYYKPGLSVDVNYDSEVYEAKYCYSNLIVKLIDIFDKQRSN